MPTARVNGTGLYYEMTGSGPALLFMHGENHGVEMFAHQVEHFSARYRCITYYRRGHGRSDPAPYGYSLWNQTLDLEGVVRELDLQRPLIVAVAMSTPIAVTYAVRHPNGLRGLVLASWYELDGYPRLEERRRARTPFPELNLRMDAIQSSEGSAGIERYMREMAAVEFPILPDDRQQRELLIRMFANHPPGRYVHAAEFYSSLPYLVDELREVTVPVLGVCGEDDPSPDRPQLLADMANFRQEWIPGARRFPLVEQPSRFNAMLTAFADGLPSQR